MLTVFALVVSGGILAGVMVLGSRFIAEEDARQSLIVWNGDEPGWLPTDGDRSLLAGAPADASLEGIRER